MTGSICAVRENEPGEDSSLLFCSWPRRQTCFAIDPVIFTRAAPQLADLRLYRNIVETPYVIHLAAPAVGQSEGLAPDSWQTRGSDRLRCCHAGQPPRCPTHGHRPELHYHGLRLLQRRTHPTHPTG
ncbi:MAG: hypothetical protein M3Y72_05325 [Acidobacteriota bacterium]|nr:hypothetical protein [Acidobacteriota bacterium]